MFGVHRESTITRKVARADIASSPIVAAKSVAVETADGTLIGSTTGPNQSMHVFKGIPYAAPPIGNLRWKPPEPAIAWTTPRPATEFSADCMQLPYAADSFYAQLFPARSTSEDCLYLNVWTPDLGNANLPVMVWIHGGALTRGSGALDYYNGARLAAKGVVVVTLNYRLGVFGYFAHPELVDESEHDCAGNYGLLDQIQALEWVRENIGAFGGDSGNVTIFGQSAGAWSVSVLTASPLAKGLFHRAIAQSGGRLDQRPELTVAAQAGAAFGKAIGAHTLAQLRDVPARELLQASDTAAFQVNDIVDGRVLPMQPYEIFAAGHQHRVPVLLGFNQDEGTTLNASAWVPQSEDAYISYVRDTYRDLADEYLSAYPSNDRYRSTLDAFRDYWFGWQAVAWARMTGRVGQNAYVYFFAHAPPGPQRESAGAYHASEIPYVFDNVQSLGNAATEVDTRLASVMSDYWVAFAKTGVPEARGQPPWPEFDSQEMTYLSFNDDGTPETASDMLRGRWRLWDKIMDLARQ